MGRFDGKVALVTGAAGGIGAAACARLAAEGARVVMMDLSEAPLRETAAALGGAAVAVMGDVASSEDVARAVATAVDRFDGLDITLANAGIEGVFAPLVDVEPEDFDRVIAVNLKGAWLTIKHAAPAMARRGGGSIVVTSSIAGLIGSAGLGPYVMSKHGTLGLVKTAALELAPMGIRVNAVNPGPVDNRMMRSIEGQASPGAADAVKAGFEQLVALKRYATNEEIAALMLFLASDDASYCTGGAYLADGGYTAA